MKTQSLHIHFFTVIQSSDGAFVSVVWLLLVESPGSAETHTYSCLVTQDHTSIAWLRGSASNQRASRSEDCLQGGIINPVASVARQTPHRAPSARCPAPVDTYVQYFHTSHWSIQKEIRKHRQHMALIKGGKESFPFRLQKCLTGLICNVTVLNCESCAQRTMFRMRHMGHQQNRPKRINIEHLQGYNVIKKITFKHTICKFLPLTISQPRRKKQKGCHLVTQGENLGVEVFTTICISSTSYWLLGFLHCLSFRKQFIHTGLFLSKRKQSQ